MKILLNKSSRLEMFYKKVLLKFLQKTEKKSQCRSLFFNEVVGLKLVTLSQKKHQDRCFLVNSTKL